MNWNNAFSLRTPREVTFGVGVAKQAGDKAKALGAKGVMVLTDPQVAKTEGLETVVNSIKAAGLSVGVFDQCEPEPTLPRVDQALEFCKKGDYQVLVAVGGGSTIDTGKAVAGVAVNGGTVLEYISGKKFEKPGLPLIAMPTTSGTGSECTSAAMITNTNTKVKAGLAGPPEYVYATIALVDPLLTVTMPPRVTANTGLDVLVHAVECYLNPMHHPLCDELAINATRIVGEWLRPAYAKGSNIEARANMAFASMTAGMAFSNKGLGDVHGFAGPVATLLKQAHGTALTVLMPYIMEFNLLATIDKLVVVAEALGENVDGLSDRAAAEKAIDAVRQLSDDLRMPKTLRDLGATQEMLPGMIEAAFKRGDRSRAARPMTLDDTRMIFESAY